MGAKRSGSTVRRISIVRGEWRGGDVRLRSLKLVAKGIP